MQEFSAAFRLTYPDNLLERAIRPVLCFISLSFFGRFKEAFVLRGILGL
jgi:hypothetical protein